MNNKKETRINILEKNPKEPDEKLYNVEGKIFFVIEVDSYIKALNEQEAVKSMKEFYQLGTKAKMTSYQLTAKSLERE